MQKPRSIACAGKGVQSLRARFYTPPLELPALVNLLRAASTVSLLTLLSRVTGLVRDQLIAAHFGAGALTDPACDRDGLAALLVDVLARLDQLFDAPMPYMLWVHQRPTDGGDWPDARLHVHIAPLLRSPGTQRYVAAGELGAGVYFNPVVPADAAATLRGFPGA